MSMKDYSIAIGEMLAKEQYAYHPKKKMYSKKSGESSIVVNINTDEVYFFDGDDGKITEDPNNILSEIRGKIDAITNMQAAEPGPTQTLDAVDPEIIEHEPVPQEPPVVNVDIQEVVGPAQSPNVPAVIAQPLSCIYQGEIISGFVPELNEFGKIKIGKKGTSRKTQSGKDFRPPVKFDHFEVTTVIKDDQGDVILDPIMESLGPEPKTLDIILLYNDPTLNFRTRYNEYKGGKCQCSGDGKIAKLMDGTIISCNPDICERFKGKKCKVNGILSVVLTNSPRLGGVYKFRTTGWNSVKSILSSMMFLATATGGTLAGIPLKLTLTPKQVQPIGMDTAQTIYVVNIEFAGTMQQLLSGTVEIIQTRSLLRADIQRLEQSARLALDAHESVEEIRDIEAEFYIDGGAT